MKDALKNMAKGAMSLLTIALVVTIASRVVSDLYDVRMILAAAGGAFAYQPLCKLFSKIKGLE